MILTDESTERNREREREIKRETKAVAAGSAVSRYRDEHCRTIRANFDPLESTSPSYLIALGYLSCIRSKGNGTFRVFRGFQA